MFSTARYRTLSEACGPNHAGTSTASVTAKLAFVADARAANIVHRYTTSPKQASADPLAQRPELHEIPVWSAGSRGERLRRVGSNQLQEIVKSVGFPYEVLDCAL